MNRPRGFTWRPTTTVLLIAGFVLILIAMTIAFMIENFRPTTAVQINSGYYNVWLADDEATRTKGLSGVESLSINGGMLFDFKEDGTWGIWMKDMKIPLDIIWLDNTKTIVHIRENVSPELGTSQTFTPKSNSRYVLELSAGSVKKAGIKVGQIAQFSIEEEEE